MATPTHEEIQEFYKEEIEYTTVQEKFEEDYPEIVVEGNATDDDDDNNNEENVDENNEEREVSEDTEDTED